MNTTLLITLLKTAGILHLGLLCAGLSMPQVVGLRTHLTVLPPFIRHLFWVYYTFIASCVIGFGLVTYVMAEQLTTGTALAHAVLAFFAFFWLLRIFVGTFIFDMTPYLTSKLMRVGYWCTNAVFVYFTLIYALALWKGGKL